MEQNIKTRFPIDCCAVTDQNQNNHSSQSHWEAKYNTMNQSELKLNACDLSEARENVWKLLIMNGFWFYFWLDYLVSIRKGVIAKPFFG